MKSVVLGGSTGTGAAIVRALSGEGNFVAAFHRGRHPEDAAQVAKDCGGRAFLVAQDAGSTYEDVQACLDTAPSNHPPFIHTFVHALSGASVGTTLAQTPEKIERTFNLMAHSFLWWAQGLHERKLLAPNAALIALSNPVVHHYLSGAGVIGPAKAALEAYVKSLAVELGRFGHRVFALRFGAVQTPALDKVTGGDVSALHFYISPYRRMMQADDVARFVKLLAENPEASMALNGAVVDFDTGSTLTLLDYAFGKR